MQRQVEISSDFGIQAEHIDCFKKRLRNESENTLVSLQKGMPKKGVKNKERRIQQFCLWWGKPAETGPKSLNENSGLEL